MDTDQEAVAAFLQIALMRVAFGNVFENYNELEGGLRKVEGESGRLLIRLKNWLVRQARMEKLFCGVIEQF